MALTDASFLLFWVLAIGQGQRFLERPNRPPGHSCSGRRRRCPAIQIQWLACWCDCGAYGRLLPGASTPANGGRPRPAATWGWGLVAALSPPLVYWPWFAFVECTRRLRGSPGAPARLSGRLGSWPGQSDGPARAGQRSLRRTGLAGSGGLAAALAMTVDRGELGYRVGGCCRGSFSRAFSLTALCLVPNLAWWIPLSGCRCWCAAVPLANRQRSSVLRAGLVRRLGSDSVLSSLCTAVAADRRIRMADHGEECSSLRPRFEMAGGDVARNWSWLSDPLPWFASLLRWRRFLFSRRRRAVANHRLPAYWIATDSLRDAAASITSDLPEGSTDACGCSLGRRSPFIWVNHAGSRSIGSRP